MTVFSTTLETPVGTVFLTLDASGSLTGCGAFSDVHRDELARDESREGHRVIWNDPRCERAAGELREYFEGRLTRFTIPLQPCGTEFQRRVWKELAKIPFGKTISYLELAGRVGNPRAVRAVGGANGANPIAIVVPCHRVVGSDGSLTGYGGGLEMKQKLLELERKVLNDGFASSNPEL